MLSKHIWVSPRKIKIKRYFITLYSHFIYIYIYSVCIFISRYIYRCKIYTYIYIYSTTSCEELTHWKRLWCWEGLGTGGKGDDRGWHGWMASLTLWTWVWVNSGRWWWTGRPGVLQFMGSQRVGHDWATELNWYIVWPTLIFHLTYKTWLCITFTSFKKK